jgi:hypothetical protein
METTQPEVPRPEVPQSEVPQPEVPQSEVPQTEVPQSTVTAAQAKREKSDRLWKLAIRAFATVFAILALALQIVIVVRRVHLETTDEDPTSSIYDNYYAYVWPSPESYFFVSLLLHYAAMHISMLTTCDLLAWSVNCLEWFRIHHSLR